MAESLSTEHPEIHVPPVAILCCSAETGAGVEDVIDCVTALLDDSGDDNLRDVVDWDTSLPAVHASTPSDLKSVDDAWGETGAPAPSFVRPGA